MLFLALDDIEDSEGEIATSENQSKATQKVDLDLDDAPFLEDEDDDEDFDDVPDDTDTLEELPQSESKKPNKLIFIGIGVVILLLIVVILKLFVFTDPPAPAPATPALEEPIEEAEEAPAPPPPPAPVVEEPGITLLRLDKFWIEHQDRKKETRFLVARFSLTTTDERVVAEYNRKTTILRDAVYYYLKNKDLQFLTDKKNVEKLKKDLLMVINQYMVSGDFDKILFEEYLVR